MSLLEANVTQIMPATWDAAGILSAMYAHFSQTSARFTVDASTGTSGADGVLLSPVSAGDDFQICMRRSDSMILRWSIEPDGTITSPGQVGTGPAGTSPAWSGEGRQITTAVGPGSKAWLIEMDDAFFLMMTDTTNTYQEEMPHIGRIYQPWDLNDPAEGRDGLGFLMGKPDISTSNNDWFDGDSRIRKGLTSWRSPTSYSINGSGSNIKPTPLFAGFNDGLGFIGFFRYIRYLEDNYQSLTRLEATGSSSQSWIVFRDEDGIEYNVVPWQKGITP